LPGLPTRFLNTLVSYRQVLLATTVISAIALPQIVSAFDGSDTGRIIVAQKEDPKKKKEQPKAAPPPPPKQVTPPKAPTPPTVQKQQIQQQKQQVIEQKKFEQQKIQQQKTVTPPKAPTPPTVQKQQIQQQKQQAIEQKKIEQQKIQQQKFGGPKQDGGQPKVGGPKQDSGQPKTLTQPKIEPKQDPKVLTQPKIEQKQDPKTLTQPKLDPKQDPTSGQPKFGGPKQGVDPKQTTVQPIQKQPPIEKQTFGRPKELPPAARVGNVNELKGKRKEERQGNTVVIVEPGNRRIFRDGNRLVIRHDEGERMRRWGNAKFETRGTQRYTIINRGGYDIVTVTDARGHMLRRYRRFPDGREYGMIDNRRRLGIGAAVIGGAVVLGLAAPRIRIPRDRYVVDSGAPPMMLYETLEAPPEVAPERAYSLDEIRDNVELRDYVRSVDVNTINFSSGSWELSPDQIPQLQALADAMLKIIGENPATVFMLEGHTDAVGAAEDNMSLSDRRAEAVAEILTTNFNVPPENLVTQGYGEQHLRVATDGPSRENRRVQVRNITGLMAQDGQPGGGPPDGPPQGQPPG
jgi:outer membrane protein OmpA-like peptidoglycan-associated protein